ncbi:MAG: adenylate/guanylate cyclase domain-containing protein [candidate division Zixibacteria bacterium]|nr:adenylate/guanylate cyclase domain-containing protein [Candidatus Tariuqbacter arcticus]
MRKSLAAVIIPLAVGIVISLLARYGLLAPLFEQFEFTLKDIRTHYRSVSLDRKFEHAVILDVDSRSIYKLGKMSSWPRDYFAKVVDYLRQGGAEAVIFDIIFDRGIDSTGDSSFAKAVAEAGNVFFALSFSEADSQNFLYAMESEPMDFDFQRFHFRKLSAAKYNIWTKPRLDNNFFDLINESSGAGFANSVPDQDGVIRSAELVIDFNGHLYPSLSLAVLLKAWEIDRTGIGFDQYGNLRLTAVNGNQHDIPLNEEGSFYIDYLGTFQTIRYISFYDVLERRVPAEFFAGKFVFAGSSAAGMFDLKSVPVQRNFPGVEIHATILANILAGNFIHDIEPKYAWIILFVSCIIASSAGLYLKTWQSVAVLLLTSAGYIIGSLQYFALNGIYTEMVSPGAGFFSSYLAAMIYKYVAEERDKRFISDAFSHFVDKRVIKEIIADPGRLKLGGERREITVLFSDIRDFTAISEKMPPVQLSEFLNAYLTEMTNIVFNQDGLLDKYIGDAVVAFFGAPVYRKDHAVRAANSALEMISAMKNIRRKFQGTPMEDLRIGVGVNSGVASVGNMGSEYRFEYTAIGDTMNLGSRLEGLNKVYGTSIIVSQAAAIMLEENFTMRELDFVQVKGKSEPVGIYQLIDPQDDFPGEFIEAYHQGLIAYCAGDWDEAEKRFSGVLKGLPSDRPAALMLERVEYLRENPPDKNWAGLWKFEKK